MRSLINKIIVLFFLFLLAGCGSTEKPGAPSEIWLLSIFHTVDGVTYSMGGEKMLLFDRFAYRELPVVTQLSDLKRVIGELEEAGIYDHEEQRPKTARMPYQTVRIIIRQPGKDDFEIRYWQEPGYGLPPEIRKVLENIPPYMREAKAYERALIEVAPDREDGTEEENYSPLHSE